MRGCVEVRRACVARGGSMAPYIARPMRRTAERVPGLHQHRAAWNSQR